MNYNETVDYLLATPKFTKKTKLENTKILLDKLNNPQEKLKIIHVAGTNGKGSVSSFIANALSEAKLKVGLFTSPHLIKINERICINSAQIDDESLVSSFMEVKEHIDSMILEGFDHPAFFELLLAMALFIFRDNNVEYAVLETGLGGRLDATNAIDNQVLTVLTSIGFDHMNILGNSIEEISKEKAAIIKRSVPVVYYAGNEEVNQIIEHTLADMEAVGYPLHSEDYKIKNFCNDYIDFSVKNDYYVYRDVKIKSKAIYQVQNASIAILALIVLRKCISEGDMLTDNIILKGIERTRIEGRMEEVGEGIILDGAHNEDGVREFVRTVNELYKDKVKNLMFCAVGDKEYENMIEVLCTSIDFHNIILTEITNTRGIRVKQMNESFMKFKANIIKTTSVRDALNIGKEFAKEGQMLFCTGSLYLIGEIKGIQEE